MDFPLWPDTDDLGWTWYAKGDFTEIDPTPIQPSPGLDTVRELCHCVGWRTQIIRSTQYIPNFWWIKTRRNTLRFPRSAKNQLFPSWFPRIFLTFPAFFPRSFPCLVVAFPWWQVSGVHIANVVAPALFGERGLLEPGSFSSATVGGARSAEPCSDGKLQKLGCKLTLCYWKWPLK